MKKSAFIAVLPFLLLPLWSAVTFSDLDLNARGTLLFAAQTDNPFHVPYKALFSAALDGSNFQVLSCFPEKMELLEEGRTLQVRNWFGTARFGVDDTMLTWTSHTPLFESGTALAYNPPSTLCVSPDGNWTAYLRKTADAKADLVLIDEQNVITTVLDDNADFSVENVPVRWAPDSSYLVYQKDGKLLFAEPKMFFEKTRIDERYRTLGEGSIQSVQWVSPDLLAYAQGYDLYAVRKNELYTRALYSAVVSVGQRIARLPCAFDAARDSFWLDKDARAVLYVQNKRNVWMYDVAQSLNASEAFASPFVSLSDQVTDVRVFFTSQNLPIIWVTRLKNGAYQSQAFKMVRSVYANGSVQYNIASLSLPQSASLPALSPDKKHFSFAVDGGLFVYDALTWTQMNAFTGENVYTYLWADKDSLFVGGYETIRTWDIQTQVQHLVFLSSVETFGWSENGQNVLASCVGKSVYFNPSTGLWRPTTEVLTRQSVTQTENVRVYLDASQNGYYKNAIYVRSLSGNSKTRALFAEPPATETGAFTKTKPKVTIAIEALNNADGITTILDTFKKNNVRGTFFINGEFMRRFPSAVREIDAGGHQCGSMFFTDMDLVGSEYALDESFLMQGLARNEDDFYAVTGSDMSLIWHAPRYVSNGVIVSASQKSGYKLVNPTVAPLDWVTLEGSIQMNEMYKSSRELVDLICAQVKDGDVISIQSGIANGTRHDYLYDYLDVLVNTLLMAGFDIVPYAEL